jgi:hypothetical protein
MATDERFDELISTWLQETAPVQIPTRVLEEAAQRTRTSRQQVGWRTRLGWFLVPRSVFAIGTTAAVMVAAVLVLSPRLGQPEVGKLPTTPHAWSGVPIDSRWTTAQVDGLVAGPRGQLAILGELGSGDMQLSVSTDGRTWTLVPNDQFPSPGVLWPHSGARRLPAVGTTGGFLFVAEGNDVWASEDGYNWQRRADRAQDADLRAGAILAVAAGGPGLVAVGSDNKAWTSEDGSDWTLAEVPAPPTESSSPSPATRWSHGGTPRRPAPAEPRQWSRSCGPLPTAVRGRTFPTFLALAGCATSRRVRTATSPSAAGVQVTRVASGSPRTAAPGSRPTTSRRAEVR